jgi:hypothetical protein
MGYKFNPFTGSLDTVDSPNGVFSEIDISGDITLDDGGTYTTTVQVVTPTANRTISFPDATGTVALVAGSSGQLTYNSAGAQAGLTSASIGSTGQINISLAGAASTPPVTFTGSWFTGGTATTTKPQLLIEPTGTTSTAWSTNGTGLGVNAASGFAGRLLDLQTNGTSQMVVQGDGKVGVGISTPSSYLAKQLVVNTGATANEGITLVSDAASNSVIAFADGTAGAARYRCLIDYNHATDSLSLSTASSTAVSIDSAQRVGLSTTTPGDKLEIAGAGSGIILASPDGTRYRLTVANGGTLSIAAV